jgi:hypothetical protein
MHTRHSGDLARRLGDTIELVDAPAEVDHPEQEHEEDAQGQAELDQGLSAIVATNERHGQCNTMSWEMLFWPPRFDATSVTVRVVFLLAIVYV